jgi:SAM-dependent methyltransferase/alkylhydroperoxidase family enzyme
MQDDDFPMEQWEMVDEGWGRLAADFATMREPSNMREYVSMHHLLGIDEGDRVLDVACGAGLALELAGLLGAECFGLDASPRLVDIARMRTPTADIRVGDMNALPWPDASFDVVTSFRGIWATTPTAIVEALRVLRPGGRIGLTVWGHLKVSSGAWALQPLRLASEQDVSHQAEMQMGRPGVGERFLLDAGFVDVQRVVVPFAWESADPEQFARALVSTGPAFEAIKEVGEQEFYEQTFALARAHAHDGLPIRAEIDVAGFIARKPVEVPTSYEDEPTGNFLGWYPPSAGSEKLRRDDVEGEGFVWNVSRLWGRAPESLEHIAGVMDDAVKLGNLTMRQRGVLITAMASELGDSYCSLAWGGKLAKQTDDEFSAAALRGDDTPLEPADRALAEWARAVVRDPNATTPQDVARLRDVGFTDDQIFAITFYVAMRLAFSTFNDALGTQPDAKLFARLPERIREAVTWGRSPL